MKDVIGVGGGLVGLSAAWRLRHTDVLLARYARVLARRPGEDEAARQQRVYSTATSWAALRSQRPGCHGRSLPPS